EGAYDIRHELIVLLGPRLAAARPLPPLRGSHAAVDAREVVMLADADKIRPFAQSIEAIDSPDGPALHVTFRDPTSTDLSVEERVKAILDMRAGKTPLAHIHEANLCGGCRSEAEAALDPDSVYLDQFHELGIYVYACQSGMAEPYERM